jgi:hypothetical protein
MARKSRSVNSRESLKVRLDALRQYIVYREHIIDQLTIDLQKIVMFESSREDLVAFSESIVAALSRVWVPDPRSTLFEKELQESRAELNAEYLASPECTQIQERFLAAGRVRREDKVDFDFLLSVMYRDIYDRHQDVAQALAQLTELPENPRAYKSVVIKIMDDLRSLLDVALDPARKLRERWLEVIDRPLDARTIRSPKRKAKRGRPRNPDITKRDIQMYQLRESRKLTFPELGRMFNVKPETARKGVDRVRRRNKAGQSKPA